MSQTKNKTKLDCLIHRENDLKNYARVVAVTNNMFKYIYNENEKLKELIKQKKDWN